jgi:FG-GAP repeat
MALGQQPQTLRATDLNGDGLPELLTGGAGGLAVFKNVAWRALN